MQIQVIFLGITVMLSASVRLLRALSPPTTLQKPNSFNIKTFRFATLTKGKGSTLLLQGSHRNQRFSSVSAGINIDANAVSAEVSTRILGPRRLKIIDVKQPGDELIFIKGWVKTVRKQKTVAFVEVNDGSTLSGIQCVLTFDGIDDSTKNGKVKRWLIHLYKSYFHLSFTSSILGLFLFLLMFGT